MNIKAFEYSFPNAFQKRSANLHFLQQNIKIPISCTLIHNESYQFKVCVNLVGKSVIIILKWTYWVNLTTLIVDQH